jgi:FkbM family methyltransferase
VTGVVRRMADHLVGRAPTIDPGDIPPALEGSFECLDTDVGLLWMSTDDEVMRPFIRSRGTWEPEEGRLLRTLMRPGCRFLDVGANVGYFTLMAARAVPDAVIDAVEPHPDNVAALRMNLWANRVKSTVWPLALDARTGTVSLTTAPTNLGDTRSEEVRPGEDLVHGLVVPSARADDLFPGRAFDVVKIDVQGFELEVLTGMQGIVANSPGVRMVVEFWPTAIRERGADPLSVLAHYRDMGFDLCGNVNDRLDRLSDAELLQLCDGAGRNGQVNLLLTT